MQSRVASEFKTRFGREPDVVVRAPGRVNLLGGHTDYNQGYVMPLAVDRAVWVAAAALTEPEAHLVALDMGEEALFALDPVPGPEGGWSDYPRGVAWAMAQEGASPVGLAAVFASDVPIGAGLSSSAAVEVAFGRAWEMLSGMNLDPTRLALICQRAESEYVGVRCGVMDQMAAVWGREGHVLLLDCRTLEVEHLPLPSGVAVVTVDSGVRRELASSEYNRRREECEQAVAILARHLPGIQALRDVTSAELARLQGHLPDVLRRRARHVVTDNERVLESAHALREGNLEAVGRAITLCHVSLRDDYEVSSPELDLLAAAAWEAPGCYGARLTGAGFGGCIVALVEQGNVDEFDLQVKRAYEAEFGRKPASLVCRVADGVSVVKR